MIGNDLEKLGWRQGAVTQQADNPGIFESVGHDYEDGVILIIASQSCDITHHNIENDPYIELSIARVIERPKGNFTHNENPRTLHACLQVHTEDTDITQEQHVEIKAFEKLFVPKRYFVNLSPNEGILFNAIYLEGYVAWLASRYARPALPTEFNNRIAALDEKGKLRKKAKGANEALSGIYVEITPDTEITEERNYSVNLLGLVSAGFDGDLVGVEESLQQYAVVMRQAGMDVAVALRKESEVSIADIKRFKRFYYDDLSYKAQAPLPLEVKNVL